MSSENPLEDLKEKLVAEEKQGRSLSLTDLKVKLAAVSNAVKNAVAAAAAERIAKAKAKAAEMQAKAEQARERKHLLDALPGNDEKEVKERRLVEIELAVAEYREIRKLLCEAEAELMRAKKSAPAERDQLMATAQAMVDEIRFEKARIESDPDMAFFGWLCRLAEEAEKPDHRVAIEEIELAIAKGFLLEIDGETARTRQEAAKKAKEKGRQNYEERQAPFFWVRVKPRGGTPQGEQEPDSHFRYISGGSGFYAQSSEGARKRLVFFAMQDLWRAVGEAKKAAYEAAKEVRQHSYLTLADIAAGKTGQAWADGITAEKPWKPTVFNRDTKKVERLMKDGREVVNYGPVVVESPRSGVLRVLNAVHSGMFHPLRLAGAWEEQDGKLVPVDFRFFPGDNPFAGLRPVVDDGSLSPGKVGRLRAILCLAGGFPTPVKAEEGNSSGASGALPEIVHALTTRPGYRSDGTKAGEPRKEKGVKKPKKGRLLDPKDK